MKPSLAANLVLNWVCPVLSFRESLQPITAAAMCTVAINVLEPSAFSPESQHFTPLFIKISLLCGQQSGGDEASKWEVQTQAQQGTTFRITLMFTFYFLPWEPDPSQNVRTWSVLIVRFSPPKRTFISILMAVLSRWEPDWNRIRFSPGGWEPSNTG
jgi:hypothetical protein